MFVQFENCRVELVQGDITHQEVDAIVNAANSGLAGGGGVDGAIHRAAGPELMEQTRRRFPEGCPTGSAVATSAGNLKAKLVFHAVGPVWRGGVKDEADQLASAFQTCLELAAEHNCESIAFPAISTGVYGYPTDMAAETALTVIRNYLLEHQKPAIVRCVLFDPGTYGAFSRVLESFTD
jgi:O-acetyl-ADP-ribose deacetylase (regulator of RNase III)